MTSLYNEYITSPYSEVLSRIDLTTENTFCRKCSALALSHRRRNTLVIPRRVQRMKKSEVLMQNVPSAILQSHYKHYIQQLATQ